MENGNKYHRKTFSTKGDSARNSKNSASSTLVQSAHRRENFPPRENFSTFLAESLYGKYVSSTFQSLKVFAPSEKKTLIHSKSLENPRNFRMPHIGHRLPSQILLWPENSPGQIQSVTWRNESSRGNMSVSFTHKIDNAKNHSYNSAN